MRRPQLQLTLLVVVAALVACEDDERHCVDTSGRYVDESVCAGGVVGNHWVYVPHSAYTGYGTSSGSFSSATSPRSFAGVSRGGFGGIGEAHASGGGGGGGGGE